MPRLDDEQPARPLPARSQPSPVSRRQALQWLAVPLTAGVAGCGGSDEPGAGVARSDARDATAAPGRAYALALGSGGKAYTAVGKGGLLIQSPFATSGDFELLVPDTRGVTHVLRRQNDVAGLLWLQAYALGLGSAGTIQGAAQIYSTNFQHVEAVVVDGGAVKTYWREAQGVWNQHYDVGTTDAQGFPGFVQANLAAGLQFQVVVGLASGGMAHWYRDDANGLVWKLKAKFASGQVKGASLIQSTLPGSDGVAKLIVVAWVGTGLECWECNAGTWAKTATIAASGIAGVPALIQSNWGTQGNLEVVVPVSGGGLTAFWRDNDAAGTPWRASGAVVGSGSYRAAAMLQGYSGTKGNFELVALRGDAVDVFWRDDAATWHSSVTLNPIVEGHASQLGASNGVVNTGVTGINAALLKNGKVLMFGYAKGGAGAATIPACVWDPASNAVQAVGSFRNNFCSGQAPMADGKVLITGGHVGATLKDIVVYDPDSNTATKVGDMAASRWYSSVVPLPDGRALVLGGNLDVGWTNNVNHSWQIYNPVAGMGSNVGIPTPFSPHYPSGQTTMDLYPLCFVLPSGQMLVHTRNTTRFYDIASGSWTGKILKNVSSDSRTYPFMAGSAPLPLKASENWRVRYMVAGGGAGTANVPAGQKGLHSDATLAATTCELLDLGATNPAWAQVAPLNVGRLMADLVALPDGTLLCVGGNAAGHADQGHGPTLRPELYDPATNTWTLLASLRVARGYHGSALLLPDARVAILGKDGDYQSPGLQYAETRAEVFSPPYLYKGTRPVLGAVPATVGYGQSITVGLATGTAATAVDRVVLVACGSVTHQCNFTQRVLQLAMTRGATALTLQSPPNANVAPPGYYMLFLIGTNGVPSVSKMVQVKAPNTLVAQGLGSYSLPRQTQAASLSDLGEAPRCAPVDGGGPLAGTGLKDDALRSS